MRNLQDIPQKRSKIYKDQWVKRGSEVFKVPVWIVHQNKLQIQQARIIKHGTCCLCSTDINNIDWSGAHASVFVCPLIFTMMNINLIIQIFN